MPRCECEGCSVEDDADVSRPRSREAIVAVLDGVRYQATPVQVHRRPSTLKLRGRRGRRRQDRKRVKTPPHPPAGRTRPGGACIGSSRRSEDGATDHQAMASFHLGAHGVDGRWRRAPGTAATPRMCRSEMTPARLVPQNASLRGRPRRRAEQHFTQNGPAALPLYDMKAGRAHQPSGLGQAVLSRPQIAVVPSTKPGRRTRSTWRVGSALVGVIVTITRRLDRARGRACATARNARATHNVRAAGPRRRAPAAVAPLPG